MVPQDNIVAVATSSSAGYESGQASAAIRDLFTIWGLGKNNAFGELIPKDSKVVLKPNWVLHNNQSGTGLDCLVTHTTVIETVVESIAEAGATSIVIGDAPVQGCNFAELRKAAGIDAMVDRLRRRGISVSVVDFRRTVLGAQQASQRTAIRETDQYVLFDLGCKSLLDPITTGTDGFRVTMYDPGAMQRTHAAGKHQYLIAREVIDADVIVNLPKLKSHKKAGITGALKNTVGINGNKEYLPHHRRGGALAGGDCYAGKSWAKSTAESFLDAANRRSGMSERVLRRSGALLVACARRLGQDTNIEGSWYGNDTVWRTCLDLQRILHYGVLDGTLSANRQRTVITITDAIVGGEGEGPLAPTPKASRFVTGALNTAAAEWVHARLMGFRPEHIPLVQNAFADFEYPLATFRPTDIVVRTAFGTQTADEVTPFQGRFRAPEGWLSVL